ncbi:hypothetical protein GCM10010472_19850 [Pseudonocardia halophobica]|uniref:Flavin reductase like domain-containing protein n=1 Tax=Pseudonocardia halophobica TaxID=29401 RepID=A0A9W6L094_9PSEU|nr:flavin reductase family protein [Pseudonocardia halophobica]GLL09801.1 hypothetical protein GCM10017577_09410 [Pseudonocardia halophobica]
MTGGGMDDQLQESFLEVMAGVCTPVTVITALDGERPHGTTVSAFASLSLQPAMVMIALDERSDLLAIVRREGRFGVNVLASEQAGLASRFAAKGVEKFDGVEWTARAGLPSLEAASGWLACETSDFVAGGDHTVVLGRVVNAAASMASPLIYHRRVFGTHSALGA